ncbi:MAG: HPr family phosphocarrier protein [Bifidobacteriaceae bacterium]|jgi:phosphocarrier protein|nr:HPr family phosphocarrier protein [Bifidobacteriaceae bacterium]
MASRTVTIGSRTGLHARPAAVFVEAVRAAGFPVRVGRPGGADVNAASILAVMGLGVEHADQVVLTSDSQETVDQLAELLARDLDED